MEAVPGGSEKYEVKLSKCCSQGTLLLPRILYFTEVLSPHLTLFPKNDLRCSLSGLGICLLSDIRTPGARVLSERS